MGYEPPPQKYDRPDEIAADLPEEVRDALAQMNWDERLEEARERRKVALAQKAEVAPAKDGYAPEALPRDEPVAARSSSYRRLGAASVTALAMLSLAVYAGHVNGIFAAAPVSIAPMIASAAPDAPSASREPAAASPSLPASALMAIGDDAAPRFAAKALSEAPLAPVYSGSAANDLPQRVAVAGGAPALGPGPASGSGLDAALPGISETPAGAGRPRLATLDAGFANVLSEATKAPPGWLGPAPIDLRVFVPNQVADGALSEALRRVNRTGFEVSKSADVPYSISETHVRFYRDSDRGQAERLARALGVSARDFSERTGSASDGIVELWLSGSGAAPRRASATRGQSAAQASAPSFAGADGNGASGVLSAITGALSALGSGAGRPAASDDGRDATNDTGPALRPAEGSPGKRKAYGRKAGKGKGSNKGGNGKSHGNNGNSGKGGGKKH